MKSTQQAAHKSFTPNAVLYGIPSPVIGGVPRLLGIDDVSVLLGLSVQTIRNKLQLLPKNPGTFPPPFTLPGSSRLKWTQDAIIEFINVNSNRTMVIEGVKQAAFTLPQKKLGRPTKVEQMARLEAMERAAEVQEAEEVMPAPKKRRVM